MGGPAAGGALAGLDFFAPLFSSRKKVEKIDNEGSLAAKASSHFTEVGITIKWPENAVRIINGIGDIKNMVKSPWLISTIVWLLRTLHSFCFSKE